MLVCGEPFGGHYSSRLLSGRGGHGRADKDARAQSVKSSNHRLKMTAPLTLPLTIPWKCWTVFNSESNWTDQMLINDNHVSKAAET